MVCGLAARALSGTKSGARAETANLPRTAATARLMAAIDLKMNMNAASK